MYHWLDFRWWVILKLILLFFFFASIFLRFIIIKKYSILNKDFWGNQPFILIQICSRILLIFWKGTAVIPFRNYCCPFYLFVDSRQKSRCKGTLRLLFSRLPFGGLFFSSSFFSFLFHLTLSIFCLVAPLLVNWKFIRNTMPGEQLRTRLADTAHCTVFYSLWGLRIWITCGHLYLTDKNSASYLHFRFVQGGLIIFFPIARDYFALNVGRPRVCRVYKFLRHSRLRFRTKISLLSCCLSTKRN